MTNTESSTLVLKDQAGNYYLVSQATLEQGRVPAEHTAEVERLVAETAQGGVAGDDVQGHIFLIGVAIGYFATKAIIEGSRDDVGPTVGEYAQRMQGIGEGLSGRSR